MALAPPIILVANRLTNRREQTCLQYSAAVTELKVVALYMNKHVAKSLQQFVSAIVNI